MGRQGKIQRKPAVEMHPMRGVENRGGILTLGTNSESIFSNLCMQGSMLTIAVTDEWGEKFVGQGGLTQQVLKNRLWRGRSNYPTDCFICVHDVYNI